MKKILAFLLAAMLLLSIVGCAAQTQPDAQPAAAEPAADTSQPTQDSVSAADGDTVTIGYYLPRTRPIPRITSMPSTSPSRRSMQRVA